MLGKKKSERAGTKLALRMGLDETQVAETATAQFFSQADETPAPFMESQYNDLHYMPEINSDFTGLELEVAFNKVKRISALEKTK